MTIVEIIIIRCLVIVIMVSTAQTRHHYAIF